jgi:hypothetical protein
MTVGASGRGPDAAAATASCEDSRAPRRPLSDYVVARSLSSPTNQRQGKPACGASNVITKVVRLMAEHRRGQSQADRKVVGVHDEFDQASQQTLAQRQRVPAEHQDRPVLVEPGQARGQPGAGGVVPVGQVHRAAGGVLLTPLPNDPMDRRRRVIDVGAAGRAEVGHRIEPRGLRAEEAEGWSLAGGPFRAENRPRVRSLTISS